MEMEAKIMIYSVLVPWHFFTRWTHTVVGVMTLLTCKAAQVINHAKLLKKTPRQSKSQSLPLFPCVLGCSWHPFTIQKVIQEICTKYVVWKLLNKHWYPWAVAWHSPTFQQRSLKKFQKYKICLPFYDFQCRIRGWSNCFNYWTGG